MTSKLHLVTGANGHLGNTLLRALLERGEQVRAGVRRPREAGPFEGLSCERVPLELQDAASLRRAMAGVDVLYQVAAVFKHWARDPQREIIDPNVEGTRLILQAAAEAGVCKVVYVSSVAAVGHTGEPLDESHWNSEQQNAYYRSKIESERMAWETARQLGLQLVVVLPAAIVGPNAHRLTDTMQFLQTVRQRKLPLDPDFHFNFVDVRDVAQAMLRAAEVGRAGERYILANCHSSSLADMVAALQAVQDESATPYRVPPRAPRALLSVMARLQETAARFTGQPPGLLTSQVRLFYGVRQEYDCHKATAELGWQPRSPAQALAAGYRWLQEQESPRAGPDPVLASMRR